MSEQEQQAQGNPYDPETFTHGGGLWDGKTITITSSKSVLEALTFKDGKPVTDDKGQQSIQIGWQIKGIADGADEKERTEVYSAGDKVQPTPDGQGFVMKDGAPLKFHANANIAKFSTALKASGFPLASLVDATGKQKLGALMGARFVFKAEAKLGRDGKAIKDKKGYDKNIHLPVKFVGYAAGVAQGGVVGAAPVAANGLDAKAEGAVLKALAGGPLTRADLVRALATSLAGDADANTIIGMVVRDDWHKGKAWKYDGTKASL